MGKVLITAVVFFFHEKIQSQKKIIFKGKDRIPYQKPRNFQVLDLEAEKENVSMTSKQVKEEQERKQISVGFVFKASVS